MNRTKQEILDNIAAGHDTSRKLAKKLDLNQEYIQRVVKKLAEEGMVEIAQEPRGYTYKVIRGDD